MRAKVTLTSRTLKYMGASTKVLDIGAAIDELSDMKEEVGQLIERYGSISKAILFSYSKPNGILPYETLDQDAKNVLDDTRREISSGLNTVNDALDKLIKSLNDN